MENPGESDWSARKADESFDDTKDSWESNASKNGDKRKDGSNKRSGSTSSPHEPSGWGAEPKTKDTGGWGTSSSNYEEVENWGITQPENGGKAPSNDDENKDKRGTDLNDNNKETGNTENSTTNEVNDSREDTRETSWGENPTEDKVNDDNWGTPNQEASKSWNDEAYEDNWGNQQDHSNDYQRREDDRPRGRGARGRGGRGGRGERGGRGGRGGRGPPRDNFRRDQDNDYRGHSHRPSNTRGRNQINDRHDSYNENERKEKERDSKFVNKKHGGLYDSIHAPKSEADTAADSAPKTDTAHLTPYVNEDRVLSGGARPQKKSNEEITEIMERMKKQNEEIEEKRKIVEEDELNFQKDEEARKKKELENRESQRRKREEEEEDRKRREHQAIQLQKEIDEAREINATNKSKSRDNREWDTGKKDYDWNNTRNQRYNNSRGGGNSYRNGSRGENPYRNGSTNDNRDYDRRGPHGNEYGERRGGRGRGDRRGDRGGDRGGRRNGRGGGGRGGGGRRYSDQHKDSSNKSEEAFGSGNSWAEQAEQQEKDNNWSNEMEWDNRNNNAPNTESADNWGSVDKDAEQNSW